MTPTMISQRPAVMTAVLAVYQVAAASTHEPANANMLKLTMSQLAAMLR
jgi:hypothetical protein